jgi:hypothetical protein
MRGAASVDIFVLKARRNQRLVLPTFTILLLRNPGRSKGLGGLLLAVAMMLRFIFWAFLSSVSLPFASQSPVQGEAGQQRAEQLDGRQWSPVAIPINAMTSLISIPYQQKREKKYQTGYQPLSAPINALTSIISYPYHEKREQAQQTSYQPPLPPIVAMTSIISYPYHPRREEQQTGHRPLSALSSALTPRDNGSNGPPKDPHGPLSGFTSQYFYTNAPKPKVPRRQTDLPIMTTTTTLVTSTRAPAKQYSTPTSDPNPFLPTISAPIPTKTALANCNVQGTPSTALTSNILERSYAADLLSCQLLCMYRSRREAYSFEESTSASAKNCVFYSTYIDGSKVVSSSSGIYFSDKYPDDGSNFCYGSTEL